MMGMDMMLKAMGLDPAAAKIAIERAVTEARATIANFENQFKAIRAQIDSGFVSVDNRLDRIETRLRVLETNFPTSNQEYQNGHETGSGPDRGLKLIGSGNAKPVGGCESDPCGEGAGTGPA